MDKNWLRLKGITPIMLLLSVFSLLQGIAIVGQALLLANGLTRLFHGEAATDTVEPFLFFALVFLGRHGLVWLQQRVAGKFAEQTCESLSEQLLQKLFELGPRYTAREGSGKLVNLALEGLVKVRTYLELSLPRMIDMMMVTGAIWIAVIRLDWISGIILLVAQPVLIMFFIILGLAAKALADKQWKSYRVLSQHFSDTLRGLETLRFLGRSRSHGKSVEKTADQYRKSTMKTLRVAFLSSLSLDFFSMLSIAFVAVGLGIRLIDGTAGLEAALAILLLAPEYFTPIRMLGTDYHATLDGKEAWASVRHILEEKEPTTATEQDAQPASGTTITVDENREESIQFRLQDIVVKSSEQRILLHNITVEVPQNIRKIGIVGASGAGKTTLLNVLGGFIEPSEGEVYLPLKEEMAFIPQHPYIFSASLRDNIAFYDSAASDSQIEQAVKEAELSDLVQQLPGGINEMIGEGGRSVSGGQAQRIALARAWTGKRPYLLLDEPTAHLDIVTEWELKQTMLRIFESQQTHVFLATHRLHWMKEMDEVWVMDNGRLAERGTHEQLKQQNSVYAKLLAAARGEGV